MTARARPALHPFVVWCPEDGDKPDRPNVHALDEQWAAEEWVEQHYADLDYPSQIHVRVERSDGRAFEVNVQVRRELSFCATIGEEVEEST